MIIHFDLNKTDHMNFLLLDILTILLFGFQITLSVAPALASIYSNENSAGKDYSGNTTPVMVLLRKLSYLAVSPSKVSHGDEFTTTVGIRLNTGTDHNLKAGYGGLYGRRDPPCQCYLDSYVILGVLDRWASLVWLVSAISRSVLHPILSYYSNRATCNLRRHRPFNFAGVVAVTITLLTIGFAADISYAFGDNLSEKSRPRDLAIFGIGL
ncbi:hypothetical protein Ahy_A04g018658 [Arachis hypogaea]|uniref:Uncharacterized protein n=1 Tax=Arachis hypogaea TaxID=3818 RepID=A0A445DE75_ARAHY|nr:hypothetical protein Ahy_A04g018658 [Arachis hypogaea]